MCVFVCDIHMYGCVHLVGNWWQRDRGGLRENRAGQGPVGHGVMGHCWWFDAGKPCDDSDILTETGASSPLGIAPATSLLASSVQQFWTLTRPQVHQSLSPPGLCVTVGCPWDVCPPEEASLAVLVVSATSPPRALWAGLGPSLWPPTSPGTNAPE